MVFVNPSKEDRERRRGVLNRLKTIVNNLSEEEDDELFYYPLPPLTYNCSCPLSCLHAPSIPIQQNGGKYLCSSLESMPPSVANQPQEEIGPEIVAALMHTEERGLDMEAPPLNVYNYLFPDSKSDSVIKRSSVAPAPLENVVVPTNVPSDLHLNGIAPELQSILKYSNSRTLPDDDIFVKSVLKTEKVIPKLNNTALKGNQSKKSTPSAIGVNKDLEPMINLVGATPSTGFTEDTVVNASSTTILHNRLENVLEYHLLPPPKHVSRVQLRGSQNPPWFPGYYIALPDSIRVVKSPSEVLPAAWQAVQPDLFTDVSFLVVR